MDATRSLRECRVVSPPLSPSPDQPGSLAQQMLAVLDWLGQGDCERRDPRSWERSRRRWMPHARRSAR